jgi:hypothetical protein
LPEESSFVAEFDFGSSVLIVLGVGVGCDCGIVAVADSPPEETRRIIGLGAAVGGDELWSTL